MVLLIFFPALLFAAASPRVVTSSPQTTELVFQLGHSRSLVAVSQGSRYPKEALDLPRVGTVFMPGVEALLQFGPQWLVSDDQSRSHELSRALAVMGISEFRFRISSLSDLFEQSRTFLKTVFGETQSEIVDRYEIRMSHMTSARPFSFLAFAWTSPPMLFGHGTFLSDLISKGGGKNLSPVFWKQPFPQVAEEWLILQRPDVVFFVTESVAAGAADFKRWWPKGNHVTKILPSERFSRASFTALEHMGEITR